MFHQDARNSIRKQFNISKLQIRLKWIVISRIAGVAYSRTGILVATTGICSIFFLPYVNGISIRANIKVKLTQRIRIGK